LENAISQFSATQTVAACYDASNFPNNEFCDRVSRAANFQLDFVTTSFFNAAEFRYKGVLAALDYRTDTPFLGADSRVGVNLSYQYLDTLTTRATSASAPSQLHNTLGYPRHQAVLNMNYENGPVLLFSTLNYIGEADRAPQEAEGFRQFPRVNEVIFVNAGFAVTVAERMRFRFSVDNIFSQDPPFPANLGSGQYFPGILGTFFRAGASVRF
jgi:iron complex outermembrane receptor protein